MNKEIFDYMHTPEIVKNGVRQEISTLLIASNLVKRFTGDDLPQGVVLDTVFTHTTRCMQTAELLSTTSEQRKTIKTILMLHDLPEVITVLASGKTADTTSPEKEAAPENDQIIADREYEMAEAVFTPLEFELYRQFEESGNYLKGKSFNSNYVNLVGIYSQLIDKTDANLTLHFHISRWALTSLYDPTQIKTERSLTYVFRQQQKFLPKLEEDTSRFYNDSVQEIVGLWKEVKKEGISIPEKLIPYIK